MQFLTKCFRPHSELYASTSADDWPKSDVQIKAKDQRSLSVKWSNNDRGNLMLETRQEPQQWTVQKRESKYMFSVQNGAGATYYVAGYNSKIKLLKRSSFEQVPNKQDCRIFDYEYDELVGGKVLKHAASGKWVREERGRGGRIKLTKKKRDKLVITIGTRDQGDGDVPDGVVPDGFRQCQNQTSAVENADLNAVCGNEDGQDQQTRFRGDRPQASETRVDVHDGHARSTSNLMGTDGNGSQKECQGQSSRDQE